VVRSCSVLRVAELLRMLCSSRRLRQKGCLREMHITVKSLVGAVKTLFWALGLVAVMLLIVAVFFTGAYLAAAHSNDSLPEDQQDDQAISSLKEYFGSLSGTALTLYMSMSGGLRWGEVYESLSVLPQEYRLVFLASISFTILAVMNVITAAFVEAAMSRSQLDTEILEQQEQEAKADFMKAMQDIVEDLGVSRVGKLSVAKVGRQIEDQHILQPIASLDLEVAQVRRLLTLLDREQKGEVDIDEFIRGCHRLKGDSRSVDMTFLQYQVDWMLHRLDSMGQDLHAHLPRLNATLEHLVSGSRAPLAPLAKKLF